MSYLRKWLSPFFQNVGHHKGSYTIPKWHQTENKIFRLHHPPLWVLPRDTPLKTPLKVDIVCERAINNLKITIFNPTSCKQPPIHHTPLSAPLYPNNPIITAPSVRYEAKDKLNASINFIKKWVSFNDK